jgi:cobalt-zinc-cadmium efflux system protein
MASVREDNLGATVPHGHTHGHDGHDHGHDHAHDHGHSHTHSHFHLTGADSRRRLTIVLALTAGFMVVEAVAGFWTNSLALISDAGHMLTDVGALTLALFAIWFCRRMAPERLTFGYLRFEILAALINGVALLGITGFIFAEAWQRIHAPETVQSGAMLAVAAVGLGVNLVSLWILSRGGGHSLNERGALLHVLGDVLGSVGAIVAALLIRAYGWYLADPIASALIGLLIVRSTWELLKEAVNVLMEGTPVHLSVEKVHAAMIAVPGVAEIKDLHLWSLASGYESLSAHVVVPEASRSDEIRTALKLLLRDEFRIEHTTLEIQRPGETPQSPPGLVPRCGSWAPPQTLVRDQGSLRRD